MCASEYWNADQRRATVEGGNSPVRRSSSSRKPKRFKLLYSEPALHFHHAIEALNAISGGEDIPAATIGVDGTSSVRVRALAGITSASYLTVGGETTVRNVHVEAPLSSAGAKQVYAERIGKSSIRYASCWWNTRAGQLELDERQGCNFKEARPDPRTGQKTGPTVIPRATVREGSLSLVHQKPSSTKAARSVLVSPKRRKEGHERHREDSRTRHDSDPGKFDLHWPCFMVSGIGHRKGRRGFKVYYGSGPLLVVIPRSHG
ncbi:unnamed protein product [Withania somnifera]